MSGKSGSRIRICLHGATQIISMHMDTTFVHSINLHWSALRASIRFSSYHHWQPTTLPFTHACITPRDAAERAPAAEESTRYCIAGYAHYNKKHM
jgi:hypothetical protein